MYDAFGDSYDHFVNWSERLSFELPFIRRQLESLTPSGGPVSILDAASATGRHAIALAKSGYRVAAADLSPEMTRLASENARRAGVSLTTRAAGFGSLAGAFGSTRFDAVLCLGNSLPHLTSLSEVGNALTDFANCLRPGGLLLIQNRNFDRVLAEKLRWMEPQEATTGDREMLFMRFYDFLPTGLIDFHVVIFQRMPGEGWTQRVLTTHLYPLTQPELSAAVQSAGFGDVHLYGNMNGEEFSPASSGNLILVGRKE